MYKMKRGITFAIAAILILVVFASASLAAKEYGRNYETNCKGNSCTTTIYSYDKYFLRGDQWEEIDESFYDCSDASDVAGTKKYCTRNYYFNVTADGNGQINAFHSDSVQSLQLHSFADNQIDLNEATIDGSVLTYPIIPNYVELKYQYLPTKLKEEIVILQPLANMPTNNLQINFATAGNAGFKTLPSTICDAKLLCWEIPTENSQDGIGLNIPSSFFKLKNLSYPVVIDPTIELNDSYISWNGYVNNYTNNGVTTYVRGDNPAYYVLLGYPPTPSNSSARSHGAIEFNVSSVPSEYDVNEIILGLYLDGFYFGSLDVELNISHMEKLHGDYADENGSCQGNCNFFIDMANGTLYNSSTVQIQTPLDISLGGAIDYFNNDLNSDIFSIGIDGRPLPSQEFIWFNSRDNPTASTRPTLTIKYGVNGTDANDAIEEGIGNALPGNYISDSQQIYLVGVSGQHYLGRFDKATVLQNQTWAFNYVAVGESFLNIPSLFKVLNTWENSSLTYSEIADQVESFINATIY